MADLKEARRVRDNHVRTLRRRGFGKEEKEVPTSPPTPVREAKLVVQYAKSGRPKETRMFVLAATVNVQPQMKTEAINNSSSVQQSQTVQAAPSTLMPPPSMSPPQSMCHPPSSATNAVQPIHAPQLSTATAVHTTIWIPTPTCSVKNVLEQITLGTWSTNWSTFTYSWCARGWHGVLRGA